MLGTASSSRSAPFSVGRITVSGARAAPGRLVVRHDDPLDPRFDPGTDARLSTSVTAGSGESRTALGMPKARAAALSGLAAAVGAGAASWR